MLKDVRIQLCGRLAVTIEGRRVEREMPGRQGRVAFAYLATRRLQPVSRDELMSAVWPGRLPPRAEAALRSILSKLRRALGAGIIEGRSELRLVLDPDVWIDVEAAQRATHTAESAVALGQWKRAWAPARIALNVSNRVFLQGHEAPWIDEWRRRLDHVGIRALDCIAASGLGLGGSEVAATERAGRSLVERSPYRESGYRWLMQAAAARGDVVEALAIYEGLCRFLRDELNTSPSPHTRELYERLLGLCSEGSREGR